MKIGHKLKNKRENKRFSQQEVADYLNVSQRTYSNFESNKSEPSLTQLSKLAAFLEFNLLDMLQEQGLVFNQSNNEFKDNSQCIAVNTTDMASILKDKETIINQQKEIIALLREKLGEQ